MMLLVLNILSLGSYLVTQLELPIGNRNRGVEFESCRGWR